MTDNELLELAAKAAGIELQWHKDPSRDPRRIVATAHERAWWNPLTDDGDALRLAVKLRFQIQVNERSIVIYFTQSEDGVTHPELYEYPDTELDDFNYERCVNHDAATRRAIVRAAAAIAKVKP